MRQRLTKEEFVSRARLVHGNKYDYSKVTLLDGHKKVFIICNKCGNNFPQDPFSHLSGCGCPHCAKNKVPQYGKRNIVCGVGIFDAPYSKTKDYLTKKAYRDWNNMLQRCYGKSNFPSKPAYKECVVCEEWHSFLNFRKWFDVNYVEGYVLDKDIRCVGNKVYSPQTCCYIPPFINTLLLNCRSSRGKYPIGVTKAGNGFEAKLWKRGKGCYIGFYHTIKEAFGAYKHERELYIKEIAQEYYNKGLINKDIYNSLINYEVKITD